jgi:CotH protein/parallel beta helix pectate lyase-like protein
VSFRRKKENKKILAIEQILIVGILSILSVFLIVDNIDYFNYQFQELSLHPKPNSQDNVANSSKNPFNLKSILGNDPVKIMIEVNPEFISSMDSALPADKCSKVRHKKVPVSSISIDGRNISGKSWIRYRGFCDTHWRTKQKSIKVNLGSEYNGYSKFNLNAIETDKILFEVWATQLLSASSGLASRVSFAELYINGKYDGVRFLVENMDSDLLSNFQLDKGEIYREVTWAYMGHGPTKYGTDVDFLPYKNIESLKEHWKKNARKKKPWQKFYNLHNAIYRAVMEGDNDWKEHVNYNHYINYLAITAITGTDHLNNHNIPIYRPRKEDAYIPIGYDFGGSYTDGVANRINKNSKYSNAQPLIISQNWLNSLFWSDLETRKKIHSRITQILLNIKPLELYEKIVSRAGNLFGDDIQKGLYLSDYASNKKWRDSLQYGEVNGRITFLKNGYFKPQASITPDWKTKTDFQLILHGHGFFKVDLDLGIIKCGNKSSSRQGLEIKIESSGKKIKPKCINGFLKVPEVLVDKSNFQKNKIKKSRSMPWRTNLGGILITISNPNKVKINEIKIDAVTSNKRIILTEDWPFFFERVSNGLVSLSKDKKSLNELRYEVINLNSDNKLDFKLDGNLLQINKYRISSRLNYDEYNPIVCWSSTTFPSCYELSGEMLYDEKESNEIYEKLIKYGGNQNVLEQKEIESCTDFAFTRGLWTILEPLVFNPNCQLRFMAGAELEFGESAYMVIKGKVHFPEKNNVVFKGMEGKHWGGVIITGAESAHVQYAKFSDANEFVWSSERYTGALNIINVPDSSVYRSEFNNNNGDDALNIRGGISRVSQSRFSGNRDAIDLDLCEATIQNNIIFNNKDDGLDLGSAGPITVVRNIISKSGDKGISVGEQSQLKSYSNLLIDNNFAIAIKDGSSAFFDGDALVRNNIGLATYTKTGDGNHLIVVKGNGLLFDNKMDYKFDRNDINSSKVEEQLSFSKRKINELNNWNKNNFKSCPSCLEFLNTNEIREGF